MNYRHSFHAGNAADCLKHALLVWMLDALSRKPAPLFVLDTHAGPGCYDLLAGPAERTGEWRDGIARLLHDSPEPLCRYVELVESAAAGGAVARAMVETNAGFGPVRAGAAREAPRGAFLYPGSPLLIRALLRPQDRLACCELHDEDVVPLQRRFRGDRQVGVHHRDGYEATRALLPPGESRGLVLIDPPYEQPGEYERVVRALREGAARFNHGVYAAWYPIKHRSPVTSFHEALRLSGLRDMVAAELWWRAPTDPAALNGCGLLVRNPPYGFEAAAGPILAALLQRLGNAEKGAGTQVNRLVDE